jgi:DNA polymerase elongation subunit (family B)
MMLQKKSTVQWKLTTFEISKSFSDWLKPEIEGIVVESKPGAEFDFVSIYPNTMLKENKLSDTINCDCCELESYNKVSELEHMYHS